MTYKQLAAMAHDQLALLALDLWRQVQRFNKLDAERRRNEAKPTEQEK